MTLPIVLAALVIAGALLYVALPLFVAGEPRETMRTDAGARRRLALVEERDRALAALRELEFDHRTGKISDRDYRELIGPLRRHAAETLHSLHPRESATSPAQSPRASARARAEVGS